MNKQDITNVFFLVYRIRFNQPAESGISSMKNVSFSNAIWNQFPFYWENAAIFWI